MSFSRSGREAAGQEQQSEIAERTIPRACSGLLDEVFESLPNDFAQATLPDLCLNFGEKGADVGLIVGRQLLPQLAERDTVQPGNGCRERIELSVGEVTKIAQDGKQGDFLG
jgi:hypothetical protein